MDLALRALIARALGSSVMCLLACSAPPAVAVATPFPTGAGEEASALDSEPSSSAAASPANPAAVPDAEQRELENTFGGKQALATLVGEASYYSDALAGRKTASGEPYDPSAYTAAHRSLPFGTVLRVRRNDTGDVVYVRVNDRGPFGKRRRILDLSKAAARHLGMLRRGIADVRVEIVERPPKKP